jgi:FkbM family methyltransferase
MRRSGNPGMTSRLIAAMAHGAHVRYAVLEALRVGAACARGSLAYQQKVRWPIVRGLVEKAGAHQVSLKDDLVVEISTLSRIERALLLSVSRHPDHVWEPQTTKLLARLSLGAGHVLIGGAYIGDQVVPVAHELRKCGDPTIVHAFEPMDVAYRQLCRNAELNGLSNVIPQKAALWDASGADLSLEGPPALARCIERRQTAKAVASTTIDEYAVRHKLVRVGLIMLDLEGGEERALRGARGVLARPPGDAPHLVFEVHRDYVDWSHGLAATPPVAFVSSFGYVTYAIRDYHDNVAMEDRPIELVPAESVHLDGPPHGFNLLATKDPAIPGRHGFTIVPGVSPKLLLRGDPRLHRPLH